MGAASEICIRPDSKPLIDYDKAIKPLTDTLNKIKREHPELYPAEESLNKLWPDSNPIK